MITNGGHYLTCDVLSVSACVEFPPHVAALRHEQSNPLVPRSCDWRLRVRARTASNERHLLVSDVPLILAYHAQLTVNRTQSAWLDVDFSKATVDQWVSLGKV